MNAHWRKKKKKKIGGGHSSLVTGRHIQSIHNHTFHTDIHTHRQLTAPTTAGRQVPAAWSAQKKKTHLNKLANGLIEKRKKWKINK